MEKTENIPDRQVEQIESSVLDLELLALKQKSPSIKQWSFWVVFSSTFITIFLAEMGDKTQLVTLLMSAESQSPWIVFLGAAIALLTTSLLGVLVGYWLAKKLSPQTLDLSIAILLLVITAWLVGDIVS
ncbi:MAG: TMEM165/GDT1 family protein [Xenococcaceae cyanobacterium MO_188.B32]|nr:TMEM165/GDT1 family protein [Xenococcaceae cyanobacterium MO_188.B32]